MERAHLNLLVKKKKKTVFEMSPRSFIDATHKLNVFLSLSLSVSVSLFIYVYIVILYIVILYI